MDKLATRQIAAKTRDSIPDIDRISTLIQLEVMDDPAFKQADRVMCYVPIRSEIRTHLLLNHIIKTKKLCVPKLIDNEMYAVHINSTDELTVGKFGIPEPHVNSSSPVIDCQHIDLCIVPMLAFSKERHRIGYGKGYYDKFLRGMNIIKLGIAANAQLFHFHPEPQDIPLDIIITEERVY